MLRTTIYLTKRQRNQLRALTESSGVRMSVHIRRAIDAYLEKHWEPDVPMLENWADFLTGIVEETD